MVVTEVNPLTDVRDMTSTLAAYLVFSFAVFGAETMNGA
jgi:agmatinase